MRRVLLEKKDIHKGSLVLVNRDHGLPRQIGGEQLQSLGGSVSMEKAAAAQLGRLLERKREIVCVSGFRSREEQEELYCRSLEEYGEVFTRKYVAEPGHSEHESGLAVDLAQSGAPPDLIRPSFPDSGVCRSFRKKAPWFGFIQRYEEGKEDVTGIACEPWHFRYVGFPHAEKGPRAGGIPGPSESKRRADLEIRGQALSNPVRGYRRKNIGLRGNPGTKGLPNLR